MRARLPDRAPKKAGLPKGRREGPTRSADPLWYRDAVLYETHVRAFFDSDADGVGDFAGLTQKLDYLQDLGITAIWLLPFYPSPLRDDGYDIADYTNVHASYGTMSDFKAFLRESHRRGLRVITELVLNHTSIEHRWFQRARRARPGTSARNFYVWSDSPQKYRDARIIFNDFEASNWTWDPVAGAYYWHRFYSHQPDLNFDNPEVRRQLVRVLDFWLDLGVDGMRLDAIPYLYEREGTNCENLPETHAFLKELRRHVDRRFADRIFIAEANQWPEDAAAYFGNGDECHMAFHFPLMPRMFMAVRMEDRFPIVDILSQTPSNPPTAQWALFLRNHDELTLEMVTDEERDYMYRVYAQDRQMRINLGIRRRLAPLLGNDRRKIELLNALLFSLPGTPVLYYGDEIGMGDSFHLGDRNGVRTPMQWSADRNAGFSRVPAQKLYLPIVTDPEFHFEAVNVEVEQNNPSSPLWWMKRLIALRKRFRAFGRGSLEFPFTENRKIIAFLRCHEDQTILVVANLSRFTQCAEIDLATRAGLVPVEMFGRNDFPPIGADPYRLTLGPHNFFWFTLEKPHVSVQTGGQRSAEAPEAVVEISGSPDQLFSGGARTAFEDLLPRYLAGRRWFGGKARRMRSATVADVAPVAGDGAGPWWVLIRVDYMEGDPEIYLLPLAFVGEEKAARILQETPIAVVARVKWSEPADGGGSVRTGLFYDAIHDPRFAAALLDGIGRRRRWKGLRGEFAASPTRAFRTLGGSVDPPGVSVLRAEQSNSSIAYGDRFVLKIIRRPEEGTNPDLEVGRFLTEKAAFDHAAPVAGAIEYREGRVEPRTLGILQGFVTNHGDAWSYTLDTLGRFFERMLGRGAESPIPSLPSASAIELAFLPLPPKVPEIVGSYYQSAQLLGLRTAELHLALASDPGDPHFAPEPFSLLYQRSLYQSIHSQAEQNLQLLRQREKTLPAPAREAARGILERGGEIRSRLRSLLAARIPALRIRIHGDYHLGQALFTGKDFVIIDFEGQPARPLSARRLKRSALVDVAGMLRSFDYAVSALLSGRAESAVLRPEDVGDLTPWARFWVRSVSAAFLKAYLEKAREADLVPEDAAQLAVLLDAYLLEKAIYEIGYELQNRPDWIGVPLQGIAEVLSQGTDGAKEDGA